MRDIAIATVAMTTIIASSPAMLPIRIRATPPPSSGGAYDEDAESGVLEATRICGKLMLLMASARPCAE